MTYQVCFATMDFAEDRSLVETIVKPSLDIDPGIMHGLNGRARCDSE